MIMKKIALVYNTLNHPELPYETALCNGLLKNHQDQLCFLIYSCNPEDKDTLSEKQLLYSSTRGNTIFRWMRFSIQHPLKWVQFLIKNIGSRKLNSIIVQWAKFAPLIIQHPDVIHLMTAAYYPQIKDAVDSSKTVVSFRGADIVLLPMYRPEWTSIIRNDLFPKVNCVHFVSNYLMEESFKWGGTKDNSKVIRIGVDPCVYQPKVERDENHHYEITLTTIGRLTWQKGFVYALKAIKILRDQGYSVQLNIIGQGESSSEIFFWRRLLQLEDCVNIVGFLNKNEKIDCLNSTDIYIQPSITEGLCVTVMEAMAMRLPVIASNVGGIPESVVDRETGILVPPADPKALAEAIGELINNGELRKAMGSAGRKRVVDHLSLEVEVEEWSKLYGSL